MCQGDRKTNRGNWSTSLVERGARAQALAGTTVVTGLGKYIIWKV